MGFLRTRMCALLKSQRKDQQDYIKAKVVAGTPLRLTNRLLVWRTVFLPDQSVRQCGYCCCLPPSLWLWVPFWAFPTPRCSPSGSNGTPHLSKIFKVSGGIQVRRVKHMVGPAFWIVLGMFWDWSWYSAYCRVYFFRPVIEGDTSLVWLTLIKWNKSLSSLCGDLTQ